MVSFRWRRPASDGLRTLVVGAGEVGRAMACALRHAPNCGLNPIGFLDDHSRVRRAVGLPVLGRIAEPGAVARRTGRVRC